MQLTFDHAASVAARDEGLASVAQHHAAWVEQALAVVYQVALSQPTLTSDDVWKQVLEKPQEPRAMGSVMRRARTRGWIAPTSTFVATEKVSQHHQPIRVWRSVLFGGVVEEFAPV